MEHMESNTPPPSAQARGNQIRTQFYVGGPKTQKAQFGFGSLHFVWNSDFGFWIGLVSCLDFVAPNGADWILDFAIFAQVWILHKLYKTTLTRVGG